MDETEQDANTVVDSSTATDDKEQTAAPSATATPPTAPTKEPTMSDAIKGVVDKAREAEKSETDKGEPIQETNRSEKKPGDKEEPAGKEKTGDEEQPPFHEHPAWQRVVKERNEARESLKAFDEAKPILERQREVEETCRANNINLKELLDVAVKMNTDPEAALTILQPVVEGLSQLVGKPTRLPDDLQVKVKEGLLDPETAAELAKLRAEKTRLESRGKLSTEQQAMQHVATMTTAMNDWDSAKRTSDPDFEKLLPQVQRTWVAMYNEKDQNGRPLNPVSTPQQAVALCEKAYEEVRKLVTGFLPPKPQRRALNSNGSSTTNPDAAPAKNMQEHVSRMLKQKHGIG